MSYHYTGELKGCENDIIPVNAEIVGGTMYLHCDGKRWEYRLIEEYDRNSINKEIEELEDKLYTLRHIVEELDKKYLFGEVK